MSRNSKKKKKEFLPQRTQRSQRRLAPREKEEKSIFYPAHHAAKRSCISVNVFVSKQVMRAVRLCYSERYKLFGFVFRRLKEKLHKCVNRRNTTTILFRLEESF